MSAYKDIFERYEKKYIISSKQYEALYKSIGDRLTMDEYGNSTVCNIYYDTDNHALIRRSLERPVYKEKLRLRSYGVPTANTTVFVELKKKYKGIVFKRRVDMCYSQAIDFLNRNITPENPTQIVSEIEWFLHFYGDLRPAAFISYDRIAYYSKENPEIRITFDKNILWRDSNLSLADGIWGEKLLTEDERIMEIKITNAMPYWLASALDECNIFPGSFSKYGTAYQTQTERKKSLLEGTYCA